MKQRRAASSTHLALAAIRGYQRWLSPRKGFCCALRSATGAASCSAFGYLVIERFGLRLGLGLLRRRLDLCGHVHRSRTPPRHPMRHKQQGHCDLPCDAHHGCGDTGAADCACDLLANTANCGDSSCWTSRKASRSIREPGKGSSQHLDSLAERVRRQQETRRRNNAEQARDDGA
jgi:putative component of membrane protein insertase Oxa1/YidC/SpoIIIJ protein YidD